MSSNWWGGGIITSVLSEKCQNAEKHIQRHFICLSFLITPFIIFTHSWPCYVMKLCFQVRTSFDVYWCPSWVSESYYTWSRIPLDEGSVCHKRLYRHRTTQYINTRDKYPCPSGIQTRYPSNQVALDYAATTIGTLWDYWDKMSNCLIIYVLCVLVFPDGRATEM
jgi:hypothetical protein